jgi:hypothetical protein
MSAMDDDLIWQYRRWSEAEDADRDDDADAACRAVFAAAVRAPAVSPDFAARTLSAVSAARARDLQSTERMRRGTIAGVLLAGAAGLYAGGTWALGALSAMLVSFIDLLVSLTVRVATGVQAGTDFWTLLAGLGRAAAAFVTEPAVTIVMLAMQGIAMVALIALRRLLGPDRESFK